MNTKATAIREILKELGASTRSTEIRLRLEREGIAVTPQQISNEKARLSKRRMPAATELTVAVLKQVKKLVDELGSTAIVRKALDDLDELFS